VTFDLAGYDLETGELRVRCGKGNRARVVYATYGARDALADWLAVRGDAPGPLLCPGEQGRPGGAAADDRAGRPPGPVQAGGAGPRRARPDEMTTTAGYDRRPAATRRKAAELIHVPLPPPRPGGLTAITAAAGR
jgi:hypothetical protein